jgi:Trypsin-like peptidase domain
MKHFLLLAVALAPGLAWSQDWAAIRERARDSMVHLETVRQNRDGTNRETLSASGFVVSCFGHVMTVAHAVPRARPNELVTYSGSTRSRHAAKVQAEVVARDEDLDLAILQLPNVQPWKPLEFVQAGAVVREDARLYALGFPLRTDLSSAEGLLSNRVGTSGRWQTTLPLNFGNSGGPVFDSSGKVVAVAAGGFDQAQAVTFVIPADYIRRLRDILPTGGCRTEGVTLPIRSDSTPETQTVLHALSTNTTTTSGVALPKRTDVTYLYGDDILLDEYHRDVTPQLEQPRSATWLFTNVRPGRYDVYVTYAAVESRPLLLFVNGSLTLTELAKSPTGGWLRSNLAEKYAGRLELRSSRVELRLQAVATNQSWPHFRSLKLQRVPD